MLKQRNRPFAYFPMPVAWEPELVEACEIFGATGLTSYLAIKSWFYRKGVGTVDLRQVSTRRMLARLAFTKQEKFEEVLRQFVTLGLLTCADGEPWLLTWEAAQNHFLTIRQAAGGEDVDNLALDS